MKHTRSKTLTWVICPACGSRHGLTYQEHTFGATWHCRCKNHRCGKYFRWMMAEDGSIEISMMAMDQHREELCSG